MIENKGCQQNGEAVTHCELKSGKARFPICAAVLTQASHAINHRNVVWVKAMPKAQSQQQP
jgi:hypothetical protein